MKKKLVSVLLTAAMVATMAVGCGGGSSDSGSSDSDGGGSGKEMTYWSMWNSTEAQANEDSDRNRTGSWRGYRPVRR